MTEVADHFKVGTVSIIKWIHEGKIKANRPDPAGEWIMFGKDINDFKNSRAVNLEVEQMGKQPGTWGGIRGEDTTIENGVAVVSGFLSRKRRR